VTAALRPRLVQLLAPVVEGAGAELEDVSVAAAGRRSVVRVVVDRDGGVPLDDVAEVSRVVSETLDELDAAEPGLLGTSTCWR
jgi:ribosome maturation factor RimP